MAKVGNKEYKTLYYSDTESGRASMRAEVNRLLDRGWRINPLQMASGKDGVDSALVVKESRSQRSKLMLIMEREKHDGDSPMTPELI